MTCADGTSSCGCHLSGGNCISLTGDGSAGNPYQIAPIIDPSPSNALSCGNAGLLAINAVPAGAIIMWPSNVIPSGWLVCQGQAVSRTTYAGIFAVTGTTYGAGDGVTTFNLPNFQGKTPTGVSTSDSSFFLAVTGGEKNHTLIVGEIPAHHHDADLNLNAVNVQNAATSYIGAAAGSWITSDTGGGGAHNNLAPYLSINLIIKT